jgi:ADP-heptose:LPS heptosyltransferase
MFMAQEPVQGLPDIYAVVHSGRTAWVGRNWISDRFAEIANKIRKQNIPVVSIGRKDDYEIPCDVDLRGETTMQQLATVMKNAKFFVGIDSLPLHIAQAMNTPGVCFFGCINPETRIINANVKSVKANGLSCLGCHQSKLAPSVATNTCPLKTVECEELVTVEKMWEAICSLNV